MDDHAAAGGGAAVAAATRGQTRRRWRDARGGWGWGGCGGKRRMGTGAMAAGCPAVCHRTFPRPRERGRGDSMISRNQVHSTTGFQTEEVDNNNSARTNSLDQSHADS